ncbi:MAG: hypothetical protein NTU83_00815 [Candidatus Hydrogenedentes bacterium]|nr:hypothetical protein [Candidatus Hydrogenedentota bacterium]
MSEPRILTFNFHEPYLCLMAKTGYRLSVGLYETGPLARVWQTQFRPVPANIEFIPEAHWRADVAAGRFDVVIAHNESNALDFLKSRVPKLLVCHNRKTFLREAATVEVGDVGEAIERLLARLTQTFEFIFKDYGGYVGDVAEVLRVGNTMRARNLMFDVDLQEAVCAGIRNRVVGLDANMPDARPSDSFDDLLGLYRSRRCRWPAARRSSHWRTVPRRSRTAWMVSSAIVPARCANISARCSTTRALPGRSARTGARRLRGRFPSPCSSRSGARPSRRPPKKARGKHRVRGAAHAKS